MPTGNIIVDRGIRVPTANQKDQKDAVQYERVPHVCPVNKPTVFRIIERLAGGEEEYGRLKKQAKRQANPQKGVGH